MSTTAQTHAETKVTQLAPYIFFYGRCEEALEFYKKVFGGSYEMMRNGESPMADQVSENFKNKVMHASFTSPGVNFFASDGREGKTVNADEGNISLALSAPTREEGERRFNALAEGGTVDMPLDDAFWGGRFGMVTDRFLTEWMITSP